MWNSNFKWFFEEGTPNGFNDGGIAEFTSTKYDGLAREIIQNSLDAKVENVAEPVKVTFEQIKFDMSLFPDIEGLLNTLDKCIEFYNNDIDNKSVKKLNEIKRYLTHCKSRGEFVCLKVSDYNTKGLKGADKKIGTTWSNLVRISGNSAKKIGSGGSFGIGKYAPFVFSNIRGIIYSTKDLDGNVGVQGKTILSGHLGDGNYRTPNGYFGEETYYSIDGKTFHKDSGAITNVNSIPEEFLRKEAGTSIYILCASLPPTWVDEVISSVVNSFYYAIYNQELVVEISSNNNKKEINKNNLIETTKQILEKNISKEIKITLDYLELLENIEQANKVEKEFELPDGRIGKMNLYLYTSNSIMGKSISHLRKAGMKIEEKSPKALINYTGICITGNDAMNEFLTNCEAPKHDAWNSNNCGSEEEQNQAKRILLDIVQWERDEIKKLTPTQEYEKIDPFGMEEYLASDVSEDEKGTEAPTELLNFKPLNTKIELKKNSKQTYTSLNNVSGISEDENGEQGIEKPFGYNNGKGGNSFGGGQPGQGGKEPGQKMEIEKVPVKYIKTPYISEGKYLISFVPTVDKVNCKLKIRLAGDDIYQNVEIEEIYVIENGIKKQVDTFNLTSNKKVIFEVTLKNIDRRVLEVSCYAKK